MTSHHAATSPSMLAGRVSALVPLLVLALAACNGASNAPAPETTTPPAETAPPTASTPVPSPEPATPPPSTAPTPPPMGMQLARYDGYGDMRLGMDVAAARKAWQGDLKGPPDGQAGCYYINPVSNPTQAYFALMIEDGKFVRYDVGNDHEVAPGGGKRGMTEAEIDALYKERVEASPHKYVEKGKYLRIKDTASPGVLVFETDAAGNVTEWHVGLSPQVDYVEGCG